MMYVNIAIFYLILDFVAILGNNTFQSAMPSVIVSGLALILALLPST